MSHSVTTTGIFTCEDECKKYGIRSQCGEGDFTTVKFKTLKGARSFCHRYLYSSVIIARERNRDSKAKSPVYDWIIKFNYRNYEKRMQHTQLTELNEFFPPE